MRVNENKPECKSCAYDKDCTMKDKIVEKVRPCRCVIIASGSRYEDGMDESMDGIFRGTLLWLLGAVVCGLIILRKGCAK